MFFYRFEEMEASYLTPRLSTAHGPIVEGEFIYFCLNCKNPGEGSVVHYHPNELLIFPLAGKINALVGTDRRIVPPGTFVHLPPYAQHQMTATEDGPLRYLYIKDKTWSTVGLSVEEAVPERATSLEDAQREFKAAGWEPGKGEIKPDGRHSSAVVEGLENCYFPLIGTFDMPPSSCDRVYRFSGDKMAFAFFEYVDGFEETHHQSRHEQFVYLLHGELDARVGGEKHLVLPGGVVHIPKGEFYRVAAPENTCVRYVRVSSTPTLESALSD